MLSEALAIIYCAMIFAIVYCQNQRWENCHLVRVIANSCSLEVVSFGCNYPFIRSLGISFIRKLLAPAMFLANWLKAGFPQEQERAPLSSAQEEPSMLEDENAGRRSIVEEPGRTRSSALLEPSGSGSHGSRLSGASSLDRPCLPLQRRQKRWQVHCLRTARPAPLRRRASSVQRSRGSSSSHFERPSRAKMARCRKRWQVRCFRGQTEPADRVSYCLERRSRQYIFCVN